jgi:hypothetical protein
MQYMYIASCAAWDYAALHGLSLNMVMLGTLRAETLLLVLSSRRVAAAAAAAAAAARWLLCMLMPLVSLPLFL